MTIISCLYPPHNSEMNENEISHILKKLYLRLKSCEMHRARDTTSLSTRSCYIYLEHLTSKFPIPTLNLNAPPHRFHRKNCKPCHHASKPKTKPHLSYPTPKCLSQQPGMHNYAVSGLSTTSYHCAHTEVVIRSRHARGCHPSPPATQAFNSRNA